jgi:hypothetical protein
MGYFVSAYVVEDENGDYMELFGDQTQAEQYVDLFAFEGEVYGRKMTARQVIVEIQEAVTNETIRNN